jgi:lactoylglutathione lyase
LYGLGGVKRTLSQGLPSFPDAVGTKKATDIFDTSIFVNNMAESVDFYTDKLGLKLLGGPHHYPGNADMAFVGEDWNSYIELVYDLEDHDPYGIGNRYEHLAIEIDDDDLAGYIDKIRAKGVKITREPKKSPGGSRAIAFIEDPNGIPVELLEKRTGPIV